MSCDKKIHIEFNEIFIMHWLTARDEKSVSSYYIGRLENNRYGQTIIVIKKIIDIFIS